MGKPYKSKTSIKMKLFYFLTAFAAAKDSSRHARAPNTDWLTRLEDLKRIGDTCPQNLPLRGSNQKPVGRHITRKIDFAYTAAENVCRMQQQVCIDEFGAYEQDKSRSIDENNACQCIIDLMDSYYKFFNHVKQNGLSDKGKDHGNRRKRITQIRAKLITRLNASYGCSL